MALKASRSCVALPRQLGMSIGCRRSLQPHHQAADGGAFSRGSAAVWYGTALSNPVRFLGPVNDQDPFYYRLTGLYRDANTEQIIVPDDRVYIAPAMWKPDEDTKLTILGEYSRTKTGGLAAYYNDPTGNVTDYFAGNPAFNDSGPKPGTYRLRIRASTKRRLRSSTRMPAFRRSTPTPTGPSPTHQMRSIQACSIAVPEPSTND